MNPPSLNVHASDPDVNHRQAAIRLDRMQTELRRGRPVALRTADPAAPILLLAAVETLNSSQLADLLDLSGAWPRLLLTAERSRFIGWPHASEPRMLLLKAPVTVERVQRLAAVLPGAAATTEQGNQV
ncbi:MAG TPA: hypothetical protein VLE45_06580, partial [Burkholderiaceae bacterium]|nr:hypothetical protein [Burkholderiaceae bacterium]